MRSVPQISTLHDRDHDQKVANSCEQDHDSERSSIYKVNRVWMPLWRKSHSWRWSFVKFVWVHRWWTERSQYHNRYLGGSNLLPRPQDSDLLSFLCWLQFRQRFDWYTRDSTPFFWQVLCEGLKMKTLVHDAVSVSGMYFVYMATQRWMADSRLVLSCEMGRGRKKKNERRKMGKGWEKTDIIGTAPVWTIWFCG